MSTAPTAVQLTKFALGIDPVTPATPLLIPVFEPLSIGPPPIVPDLVKAVGLGYSVRRVESRSGHAVTCPLDVAARPRWTVAWTGLTLAQRNTLAAWFKGELFSTLFAWDLEPDGPETGIVHVRFIQDPQQIFVNKGAFSIAEATVEEVFS